MIEKNAADHMLHTLPSGDDMYVLFENRYREQQEEAATDQVGDVLQKLGGANLTEADSDELLIQEVAALSREDETDEVIDDGDELDLSAGVEDQASDPVG